MANMTTRVIAQKSNRLNKDIMKYIRYNKIKYKECTYTTKNNRKAKEYILSSKDAVKVIKRFNKSYTAPVKVKVPVAVAKPVSDIKVLDVVKSVPNSIIIADGKKDKFLEIYAKYALNSKAIRRVALDNIFKPASNTGLTIDQSFEMLVDTINAFSLHDSISAFTYNLANDKVPTFKRGERSYHHFLKSLYWSIIRAKQLQDHPVCCGCGTTDGLQVHHPDYNLVPRGTEYMHMNIMATMCDECHKKIHNK